MVKSAQLRLTSPSFAYNSHHERADSAFSRSLTFKKPSSPHRAGKVPKNFSSAYGFLQESPAHLFPSPRSRTP